MQQSGSSCAPTPECPRASYALNHINSTAATQAALAPDALQRLQAAGAQQARAHEPEEKPRERERRDHAQVDGDEAQHDVVVHGGQLRCVVAFGRGALTAQSLGCARARARFCPAFLSVLSFC